MPPMFNLTKYLRTGVLLALLIHGTLFGGVAGEILPLAITSVSIVSSCPSVGSPGAWAVTSTGGAAPVAYRFYLRNATAGTWAVLKDYDTVATAAWMPA